MGRRLPAAVVVVALCSVTTLGSAPAREWWAHLRVLADDALEGRGTGTAGHRRAAEYVAHTLAAAGLEPAGTAGFFQPIALVSRRLIEERSTVELVRDGRPQPVRLGRAAVVSMRVPPADDLEAPLVFAGYGLSMPQSGHDDTADIDLRGRVAVVINGGPAALGGPLLAHAVSTRWTALERAGAVGLVTILGPDASDLPWERIARRRLVPVMTLADPSLGEAPGQQIALTLNPAFADGWFEGSGHRVADLLALANQRQPLPRFPLTATLRARLAGESQALESDNVAAVLRGRDPELRHEHVVVTAHLDHIGRGAPVDGDDIYNGAMDNASGTATLLEVARRLAAAPLRPRRSILFLGVTAEEHGLLGSKYFVARPTVPGDTIVANLNTDMFLPLFPFRSVIVNGLEESDLADDLHRAARAHGIDVLSDPEPERRAFVRSDQYSFVRRGVPALAFKVGWTPGSPEHETVKRWRRERYHAPSDDLRQPIDLRAAEDFTRFFAAVLEMIANRDTRPVWNEDSIFRPRGTQ